MNPNLTCSFKRRLGTYSISVIEEEWGKRSKISALDSPCINSFLPNGNNLPGQSLHLIGLPDWRKEL